MHVVLVLYLCLLQYAVIKGGFHAFNNKGLEALKEGPSRPHHTQNAFSAEQVEELIARKPRTFDKPTSLWTLDLLMNTK